MANQRDIAIQAGLTQATVSMALRNHPSLKASTKARVLRIAHEIGYKPNPLVSSLMAQIRSGRHSRQQGSLAVLVSRKSMADWIQEDIYRSHCEGITQRAERLGYNVDFFFLEDGWTSSRLDRVLNARGICGVLFAAPQNSVAPLLLKWERYTCATIGASYIGPRMCRVASYHEKSVERAFRELLVRGYRRPGMCLAREVVEGSNAGWFTGFLYSQTHLPAENRIPLFIDHSDGDRNATRFTKWFKRHQPDAVISLAGVSERAWLRDLSLRIPGDVGLVCVSRPEKSDCSGIVENSRIIGATAIDFLTNQIYANERGLSSHPKVILIEGAWIEGKTLRPCQAWPADATGGSDGKT